MRPSLPSGFVALTGSLFTLPPPHEHAGADQHDADDASDDAVRHAHPRQARVMAREEGRQLVSGNQEIDGGNDEQNDAEQGQDELHGASSNEQARSPRLWRDRPIIAIWPRAARCDVIDNKVTGLCVGAIATYIDETGSFKGNIDAMTAVRDNKGQRRFELDVEGQIAFANYRETPQALIITHTETPRALRGRGIASELVKGALQLIRADGHKVIAGCGFVVDYLDKHPEYRDLMA
jgi:uncharacterized protein